MAQGKSSYDPRAVKGAYDALVFLDGSEAVAIDSDGEEISRDSDHATVIQAAIDAADTGDTLRLSAERFVISSKLTIGGDLNLIGSGFTTGDAAGGDGTQLRAANSLDDTILEVYSGGTIASPTYTEGGSLSNFQIHGNQANNTSTTGLVLAWTKHWNVSNVIIRDCDLRALEVHRSFWTQFENVFCWRNQDGILCGSGASNSAYNGGGDGDLECNAVTFYNTHVQNGLDATPVGQGFTFANGRGNRLVSCDASGCVKGLVFEPDTGGNIVEDHSVVGMWFENDTTGVYLDDTNAACRNNSVIGPVFTANVGTDWDDQTSSIHLRMDGKSLILRDVQLKRESASLFELRDDTDSSDVGLKLDEIQILGNLNHDGTSVGFFGTTPVAQQTDPTALTDSTGGTTDGTLSAVSGSGDDATINNNFAELAEDLEALRAALANLGLIG